MATDPMVVQAGPGGDSVASKPSLTKKIGKCIIRLQFYYLQRLFRARARFLTPLSVHRL
jgi:hypothetical protein